MTTQKESRGFSNFGFSTILLSFVMICVVTFSALSLVTAHSDYKLSKKVAAKTEGYFKAEEQVYEKLAALDQILIDSYHTASGKDAYYSGLKGQLEAYGTFEDTPEGYYLTLIETISQDHHLSVKIFIQYPAKDSDTFYRIEEWKSVYTMAPPEDGTLNLIQ